jgi:hypothetical protein
MPGKALRPLAFVTNSEQSQEIHKTKADADFPGLGRVKRGFGTSDKVQHVFGIRNSTRLHQIFAQIATTMRRAFGMISPLSLEAKDAPGGKKPSHAARETRPHHA